MPTLNGDAAIQWMRAKVTNVPGSCLNTIWQAYGSHLSVGPHAGQYPDAIDGWRYATRKHPGDPTPPAGFPVYFDALTRPRYAGDTNYASGDIVLSLGGGQVICTDGAGAGRISVMSITQRARQIGRTYLGWAEDFLGYDVVTTTSAASGATLLGGFLMALSDDQQNTLANQVNWLYQHLIVPNQGYSYPEAANNKLDVITQLAQASSDALTKPSSFSGQYRPIDVLVSQVPAILAAVTGQHGGGLTDAQVATLAQNLKAGLGDELAADLAKRLAS